MEQPVRLPQQTKKEGFIDYSLVLSEYGGDNNRARKAYFKALYEDLSAGMEIHEKIFGQSILGGDEFIEWVTEEFLKGEKKTVNDHH